MSSENPLNRSSCSLRKPSQMPGRHCEAFVTASQVLPVQLRNSCMYNALHLLGCHESWRTEGKLWNHIFSWLICWKGKHSDKNNGPSRFSHSSVQPDLRNLWVLPAVALALVKPNVLPCGGICTGNDSSTTSILSIALYCGAFETHKFLSAAVLSCILQFCKMEGQIFLAEPYVPAINATIK